MLQSSRFNLLLKLKHKLNHSQQLSLSSMIVLKVARHVYRLRERHSSRSVNKSERRS